MCLVPSQTILSTDETGSIAPPIFTSVGQDAVNGPGDVFVIQSLLNRRLPQPHVDIPVTGAIDPGTILAIKTFQAVAMNMNPPSGHVAPASATYYALAARPLVSKRPALATPIWTCRHPAARSDRGRQGLANPLGHPGLGHPGAVDRRERLGVGHAARQQQPVWHQGAGLAAGGGKRNPRSGRGQDRDHRRKVPAVRQPDRGLRGSWQAAGNGSPYQAARTYIQDPDRFADALTGVYATDPQYGETLKWVMDNYKLKAHEPSGSGG